MSWQKVKLSKVLRQYRLEHIVQNDTDYKQVTISKHDGVCFRGLKKGYQIGRKRQFLINLDAFPNTLMFVRQGVYEGAIGIAPEEVNGCIATENMPMFSIVDIDKAFLNYIIKSPYFKSELSKIPTTGSAQKSIHERQLLQIEIPYPSIDEQRRIVELLNQDELSINKLINGHNRQLDLLKKLRQQILQDAVQGKLVPQDPNDEPASKLLERIKAEKEELVREKKIKNEKPLPPIKPEELPFEIPENWVWCRLSDIGSITGGGTPSMANPEFWNGDIPWISPKDMISDYVQDTEMKVTQKGIENSTTKIIPKGSIIIVGRSGILKRKLPVAINEIACTVNQDMKVIIPHLTRMNRYLQLMLFGLEKIVLKDFVKFGMTVHSLKYDEFADMPIPLPPITEQHRIVAKIEQLMTLCNELEQSLLQNQKYTQELLQVALKEALEPKIN